MSIGQSLSGLMDPNNPIFQIFAYSVASQVLGVILQPELMRMSEEVWGQDKAQVLSPAELASAVVRGFREQGGAADEAGQSGYSPDRFRTMVQLAGQAPSPGELAEALRRQLIPRDSGSPDTPGFVQGIEQGNLANKWADMIQQLSIQWPTPTDALQAYLEGQVDQATAQQLYQRFGGDPAYFDLLYNTRGSSPSPLEAATMARRGIIPEDGTGAGVVSFKQAFLEGPWRNKWSDAFWVLSEYHPPPRTIVAMIRDGALSTEQATTLLAQAGVPDTLIAAYIHEGSTQKTAAHKNLAVGTVTALYRDQIIPNDQATTLLEDLGYDAAEAGFILAVQDGQVAQQQVSAAVGRIRTLYESRKISRTAAHDTLAAMHIVPAQIQTMLTTWDYVRAETVRHLTPAEIAGALHHKIITQDDAQGYLEGLGYSPYEAWLYLSQHEHVALPGQPEKTYVGSAPGT